MTGIQNPPNKYLNINNSIFYQIDHDTTPKYIFGDYINKKKEMLELINAHRRSLNINLIPKIFNDLYFLRSDQYKYIKYDNLNIEEFYDLSIDLHEQRNIINENDENCRKMKYKIERLFKKIQDLEELEEIITKKEKDTVNKIIGRIKIKRVQ